MATQGQDNDKMARHAKQASDLLSRRKGTARQAGGSAARRPSVSASSVKPHAPVEDAPSGDDRPPKPEKQAPPTSLGQFVMRNLLYILSAVAVVFIIGLVVIIVAPSSSEIVERESMAETAYVSPYDWTKLDRTDGRYAYIDNEQVKSRFGIDVSENQHEIDWNAVASDGVDFAMIRLGYRGATEGDLYLDERYYDNIEGARSAGIDCGIYFFSQARTADEAVAEAEFVLDTLAGAQLEYPIAFDSEESVAGVSASRTSGLGHDEMTAVADAFCDRIEAAGYRTLVYGNANDLSRYNRDHLDNHTIWWAEYGMPTPTAKIDFAVWQYSNSGTVAGIPAAVDLNIDLSGALD